MKTDTITYDTEIISNGTYNVYITDTVRVNVNKLDDGRILYQLESALFDRWVPCGECVEYTNIPE